jgi:hypothetical protein
MGQGIVRLHEPVTAKISRKAGNEERSRQGAKAQKRHAKNSVRVF